MGYVTTRDNVRIFYRLIGCGSKTILFIHPPGMGHITFKQQLPLSTDFRLLYVDLRGNGNSGKNEAPITFHLLSRDLFDVCQQLEINKVVLCGYSNGASIALETTLNYPDLVEGLVLIGAFPKVDSLLLYSEFLLGILTTQIDGVQSVAKTIAQAHAYSKDFEQELASYIMKTDATTLHQYYTEGLAYNCATRLGEITSPILLIYGQRDYYVHHYQKEFQSCLPNTKVIYVSGAKHQIPTKYPNELNAILKQFTKKL
ncbi:hypothetical protein AB685_10395 [Bacillus sp. LL01]|uniref:alpha/beta fold hydrolase n=1 Tax=Bacillus sp. LL01 TaxID=1665556 RepID=UPI00064D6B7C|nr:alpha/beta hydrolase [Bacillus sp. LL01]KMJ58310.1 hypothetical protein AB685_10395 [Bacillus sp. LL01]